MVRSLSLSRTRRNDVKLVTPLKECELVQLLMPVSLERTVEVSVLLSATTLLIDDSLLDTDRTALFSNFFSFQINREPSSDSASHDELVQPL